ncbi:MAG TPA: cell division protein ZapA [Melioribacteraceae bacterium]|nr:cell division protein ZapA [Melioribacteraceae bacterium]
MTNKKKLKVNIFGKEYALLVENEEIALELTKYVNNIFEDTLKDLSDQPRETIAVISALNIAYDLFVEKNEYREFKVQAIDRIKKIKLLLTESNNIPETS